jgi:RNA polymerase sigma factor for flagellar operon FliA
MAGDEVARRYLPMVRRIAMRTVRTLPAGIAFDDILGAGWLGLSEALHRRQPSMPENEFEAYASHRVRGAILDYLRDLDPLSRKLRQASRNISRAAADLVGRLGRYPTEEELAVELGLELEQYQSLLAEISRAGHARFELSDNEASANPSPEAEASLRELAEQVSRAVDELPERLRMILGLYYQEGCSLREIGEILGVTESRVCQLHSEAIHLIRARLDRGR